MSNVQGGSGGGGEGGGGNGAWNGPSLCQYSLIVMGDAIVSSHSAHRGIAIGGRLFDGSPQAMAVVSGASYVGSIAPQTMRMFSFQGGLTLGSSNFPFVWSAFEYLARTVVPTRRAGGIPGNDVHVICRGGRYSLDDFYHASEQSGRTGINTFIIFNTYDTVTLGRGTGGAQGFSASVFAPFSTVTIEDGTDYVGGFVVARNLAMGSGGSSSQLHGQCFVGGSGSQWHLTCGSSGSNNCAAAPAGPRCVDAFSVRKCERKLRKGKCRKRGVRLRKCRRTCGCQST